MQSPPWPALHVRGPQVCAQQKHPDERPVLSPPQSQPALHREPMPGPQHLSYLPGDSICWPDIYQLQSDLETTSDNLLVLKFPRSRSVPLFLNTIDSTRAVTIHFEPELWVTRRS